MRKGTELIVFTILYTLIYGFLNWYVLWRFSFLFAFSFNWGLITVAIIGTFSFTAAFLLENYFTSKPTNILYRFAASWMGVLGVAFPWLLGEHLLSRFVSYPSGFAGFFLLIITLAISAWAIVRAQILHTRYVELPTKKLKRPVRIVHISDLHLGPVHQVSYLDRIVKRVNQLKPDYVCITGDIVDGPGKLPDDLLKDIRAIRAPMFFSSGNHDVYVGMDRVRRMLKHTDVTILSNEVWEYEDMTFIGVEDGNKPSKLRMELPELDIPKSKYNVLLYHRPHGYKDAARHGVNLMLSGHTHAGQIAAFTPLVRLEFKFVYGLYRIANKMWLNVTSGVGTWGPPMRLGSRSEVVAIDLLPQK